MALGITSKSFGGGDDSWMGSRHGVETATTITLDESAFTDKLVKSGTPIVKSATDGLAEPYDTGDVLYGFVIGDHDISDGDTPVAVMWHGRVIVDNLPVAFTPPAAAGLFDFVS